MNAAAAVSLPEKRVDSTLHRLLHSLAAILAYLSLALSATFLYRVSGHVLGPGAFLFSIPKIFAGSLAPFIAIMSGIGAVLGLAVGFAEPRVIDRLGATARPRLGIPLGTLLVVLAGAMGAGLSANYVRQVTAPHKGFEQAFGPDWETQIPADLVSRMLQKRWTWKLPASPQPRWERDVAFWTIPGSNRKLLADIWQPPANVKPSGLAFIYFHGGGYVAFDKDMGTRPLFRHLASQGHVIMDVSYRLIPETNLPGMMGDAFRAIVWMKRNAARYGADPDRIVLGGGSAGAHLALLAAYAPNHPLITPEDVRGQDLRVRGVVAYYNPGDVRPERQLPVRRGPVIDRVRGLLTTLMEKWAGAKIVSDEEWAAQWFGGQREQWPEQFRQISPISHVGSTTPPTLQFMGGHDVYVSAGGTVPELHRRLREAGVPSVYVEFPRTDHAFDLFFPEYSPPTQAALYDLDRFLALMVSPLILGGE